ncbi:MAG: hypothetical protein HETSPECPRED_008799 [Heterodermia speciosa]|uniref:3-oxoacyl-[acyl-carrier-protein] reductase n=1 Tax=Heterodermia speciosa TaxID=116794 RepID=A0A8H3EKW0_9LECA|nr:MAG: hypothetical protein HETSPECPRED_008799 [Heterodermia speciosa]
MLTTDLKPHLALITGATGGIGRATCLALANFNCSLAIHYHSAHSTAEALVTDLRSKGIRTEAFQADLRRYDGVRELYRQVIERLGHPTILFNNAGIAMKSGVKDVQDVTVEMFEETWRANCGSAYLLTQLCLPEMEKKGSSKSALHGLIHWLSQIYGPKGVTVNGVAPALITGTTMLPGEPEDLKSKIPIGRLGTPEEVAETVLWMYVYHISRSAISSLWNQIF